ncbi:glycosyltransferase [Leuconostoc citreum]
MLDVSVVIPVYKGRPFIEETVLSVLSQRDVAFDLSIALQGPEDGTRELLAEIAKTDSRLKILMPQLVQLKKIGSMSHSRLPANILN